MAQSRIEKIINENAALAETSLDSYLPEDERYSRTLNNAMRYSVLGGGKRIRPTLVIEFSKLFGGSSEAAMPFAAAIEMIHCASLVHDDLPSMDNDDMRRGKPSAHRAFGDGVALQTGDALFVRAFEVAAENDKVSSETVREAVRLLAYHAGMRGMISGQVIDILAEGSGDADMNLLLELQSRKTGALIRAACELGCICAPDMDSSKRAAAIKYADNIGLAFQITDDILDAVGDEGKMGKTLGKDIRDEKITFLSFMSIDEARKKTSELTSAAIAAIAPYSGCENLTELAGYLFHRDR